MFFEELNMSPDKKFGLKICKIENAATYQGDSA
jgi:hypothetical protein